MGHTIKKDGRWRDVAGPQKTGIIIAGHARSLVNFRGRLIQQWRDLGWQIIACAPNVDSDVVKELAEWGVRFMPVSMARTSVNALKDVRGLADLTILMRKVRPSWVFSYTMKPVLLGSWAARLAGVPSSFSLISGRGSMLGCDVSVWRRRVILRVLRASLSRNTRVLFQNTDDLELFEREHVVSANRAFVVDGSGVDLELFRASPLPSGKFRFVMAARLIREKGILEFLLAVRELRRSGCEVEAHLVGGVDDKASAIKEEQLRPFIENGDVVFHGEVLDVRPFFERAHVVVLPTSYGEGIPRSLMEGMAMGRPVLTTDLVGARELVPPPYSEKNGIKIGNTGFLIPRRCSDQLIRAMRCCLEDRRRLERMAVRARKYVEERFDVIHVNRQICSCMTLEGGETGV